MDRNKEYTFLVGSRALGMESEKSDYDFLNYDGRYDGDNDKRIGNIERDSNTLIDGLSYIDKKHWRLSNYQYDKDVNPNAVELGYDIFEFKDKMIDSLKEYIISQERWIDKHQDKAWYSVVYQYYMLLNNSKVLTEEQKLKVKKIHDRIPNQEFLHEICGKIKTL